MALWSFEDILGSSLHARDGKIGHLDDFLFDDRKWTVRYLVVRTGGFLKRQRVLISPLGVAHTEWSRYALKLDLTRSQIESSPDVSTDEPVFRKMEERYFDHYGWPYYWTDIGTFGIDPMYTHPEASAKPTSHLRSCRIVGRYSIEAEGARCGHVADFLFDDSTWVIRYLMVQTVHLLSSRPVLISPEWVENIRFEDKRIRIAVSQHALETSPEYQPGTVIEPAYEDRLRAHFQKAS